MLAVSAEFVTYVATQTTKSKNEVVNKLVFTMIQDDRPSEITGIMNIEDSRSCHPHVSQFEGLFTRNRN